MNNEVSLKISDELIITNLSLSDLFIRMQPDEISRQEAINFLKTYDSKTTN